MVVASLSPVDNRLSWWAMIEELRYDLGQRIQGGEIDVHTAAHATFVLDLLEVAGLNLGEKDCSTLILGFVGQLAISEKQWRRWLSASGETQSSEEKLTLERFPWVVMPVLARRRQMTVLREVYKLAYGRVRPLCNTCIRESTSYGAWLACLATLLTALREVIFLKVTRRTEQGSTAYLQWSDDGRITGAETRFNGEEQWDPVAQAFMSSAELSDYRRDEAFCNEQFAHVFAALIGRYHLPETLDEVAMAVRGAVGPKARLRAREELRLMRNRFQIPQYLFAELDSQLRSTGLSYLPEHGAYVARKRSGVHRLAWMVRTLPPGSSPTVTVDCHSSSRRGR